MSDFATIEQAIEDIKNGKMLVVVDDEDRENEGDLIVAAEKMTPEHMNFMATHARGLICTPIIGSRLDELEIGQMVENNTDNHETAFTVSVDAYDTTTGISAYERCHTVKMLLDPAAKPVNFRRPGHVFPLRTVEGGVLRRAGHTEATTDLARMAGLFPAGLCCEIMADDGHMMRTPELKAFAKQHGLNIITIKDLIAYRLRTESIVERGEEVAMPTQWGDFRLIPFKQKSNGLEHIALIKGDVANGQPVLVRVHSSCATGDIFGSMRCECGEQLHKAMELIEQEGRGVVVYLNQEGRGIGLMEKIRAYKLQEEGLDTVEANLHLGHQADERDYGVGAQILQQLGIQQMRLLSNNPIKRVGLEGYGLEVVETLPLEIEPNEHNSFYMQTKKDRMGHILPHLK